MSGETILHIGRHKSGTSSLQHALTASAARLAEAGYLYPRAGLRNVAHHHLANAFLRKGGRDADELARFDALVEEARAELAAWPGTAIVSSEAFQNVVHPERLARLFDPARTHVVVYLRDPFAYAQSAYAQAVHNRRVTEAFADYLDGFTPDYLAFLDRWRSGFAPARLTVRAYDRRTLAGGDIVRDFAEAIGLPEGVLAGPAKEQNPSIGGALLAFKRALNGVADLPPDFDRAYTALSRIAGRDPAFRVKPTVSAEALRAFRARTDQGLRALVRDQPQLATLLDHPPAAEAAPLAAEDFAAVWRALDAAAPAFAAAARAGLAAVKGGDPALAAIAAADPGAPTLADVPARRRRRR